MTRANCRWMLAVVGALTAALPAHGFGIVEPDVDRPGGDLRPGFELPEANPMICQQACEADPQCKAWTYVRPGVQGRSPRCWLKGSVPAPVKNECCVSGTVGAAPVLAPSAVQQAKIAAATYDGWEIGADRPGADYRRFEMPDARPDLCRAACEGDERCQAFTFVRGYYAPGPKAQCWLKDSAPQKTADLKCISGLPRRGSSNVRWHVRSLKASATQATAPASPRLGASGQSAANLNAQLRTYQRQRFSEIAASGLQASTPIDIQRLAVDPERLGRMVNGVALAPPKPLVAEHGARLLRPVVHKVVSLTSQGPYGVADEGGYLLIAGKDFGDTPGQVRLTDDAHAWSADLMPLFGTWQSSWSDTLIAVRIPFFTEKPLSGSTPAMLELRVSTGGGPLATAVQLQPHRASFAHVVAYPAGVSDRYWNAISVGGSVQIHGQGLGPSGAVWLDFFDPITPYDAGPVQRHIFSDADIKQWSDTLIILAVPESLQGDYPFVPATLSVRSGDGASVASQGVTFGPRMEKFVTSGEEFFELDAQDQADHVVPGGGSILTVVHDPGCGLSGNSGDDWFFRNKPLPPNWSVVQTTIYWRMPDEQDAGVWQTISDIELKAFEPWGLASWGIEELGKAFGAKWGSYVVSYEVSDSSPALKVHYENSCSGEFDSVPIIYDASFVIQAPARSPKAN